MVAALGTTQTIAWASSYYMPAILGAPIAAALHLPGSLFFGLFSGALLLSAVIGPSVGRLIDRHGGRAVLAASNLVIAAGLTILAAAHGGPGLAIAWTVLGIGIGMGLYDPAFAALTWLYGAQIGTGGQRRKPGFRTGKRSRGLTRACPPHPCEAMFSDSVRLCRLAARPPHPRKNPALPP